MTDLQAQFSGIVEGTADLYVRALTHLAQGELIPAAETFRDALQSDRTYYMLYYHLMDVSSRLDRAGEILAWLDQVDAETAGPGPAIPITVHDYHPPSSLLLPPQGSSLWREEGDGWATAASTGLRIVALENRYKVYRYQDARLNGRFPVAVEFIARRRGGDEEDCGVELWNGLEGEILRMNRNLVILKSASVTHPLSTDRYHVFRLVLTRNGSHLYVNGQLVLQSPTPIKGHQRRSEVEFGSPRGVYGGDSESEWLRFRILQSQTEDTSIGVLAPIPRLELAHLNLALFEWRRGNLGRALEELRRALLLGPGNEQIVRVTRELLHDAVGAGLQDTAMFHRLLDTLPDRARGDLFATTQMVAPRAEQTIRASTVGVRFSKNPARILSLKDLALSITQPRRSSQTRDEHFWALQDVAFDLGAGETLGVVGRNGAGKSTLLRVLAEIIPCDRGTVEIRGKPLLLTPGLGFRDDLSGRDNILFGGLFLGLTRREILDRMEDIVSFAELWDVVDRPFKYYSDGMKARLIFSVATSVEPDILLLDELLGAGDVAFQEKAAARLQSMMRKAKTIVVVTHNMSFVRQQCTKGLYLDRGQLRYVGDPNRAVDLYLEDLRGVPA